MNKRKVLGKGLGALIPDIDHYDGVGGNLIYCNVENIHPNTFQPRKFFDEDKIKELVFSIKEKGIIQPLVVRQVNNGYELIAGERRWLAAKKAGLTEIPVIVRKSNDTETLELSLIENLQREDLNPLEEAEAYKRLSEEFHLTQDEIGQRVGKDRSTVTNHLRLLKLPIEIKEAISKNIITIGHARALLGLESPAKQRDAFRQVLKRGLSVRQTEALIKNLKEKKPVTPPSFKENIYFESIKEDLIKLLSTRVRITGKKAGKGKIEIDFYSPEDLDRIVDTLRGH